MGVDIAFLPVDSIEVGFSHQILQTCRRSELNDIIEEIEKQHGRDVPVNFTSYLGKREDDGSGYGMTDKSPYGDPLKMVQAEHLKTIANIQPIQDNWQNRAVWAYIDQMPDDQWVVVYWH